MCETVCFGCSEFDTIDVYKDGCFCGNEIEPGLYEPCEKAIKENRCCKLDSTLVSSHNNSYVCAPTRIIFDLQLTEPYDTLPIWRHEIFTAGTYKLWTLVNTSVLTLDRSNVPMSQFCVEFLPANNQWAILEFEHPPRHHSNVKVIVIWIFVVIVLFVTILSYYIFKMK